MLDETAATNINLAPNRRHLPASLWTDERVEHLKKLWAEGRTATEVAAAVGGFGHCQDGGRSAICGKIHRLGLDKRERAPKRSDGGALARRLRGKSGANKDRAATQRIAKTLKVRSPSNGGAVMVESIVREEAPCRADFLGIALLDLECGHCRFPKGEGASISFCGQKPISGESWCRDCYRIVFQPPRPRAARAYLPTGGSKPTVF